jgi:hypothetical protein
LRALLRAFEVARLVQLKRRGQAPPVDPKARHLLVQGSSRNLEALKRRPDITAGLQEALTDRGSLEFPDLIRQ